MDDFNKTLEQFDKHNFINDRSPQQPQPVHAHPGHTSGNSINDFTPHPVHAHSNANSPLKFAGIIGLLGIALLLAFESAGLGLLKLDHVFIFPSLVGNYMEHFMEYTRGYGLTWPLNLWYYYGIFNLFIASSAASHIVLFGVHAITGYIAYLLFSKRFSTGVSALLGALFIAFPFFAEQYGWLSAGGATIANFCILLQLLVASNHSIKFGFKLFAVFVLQVIAVAVNEVAFFTFIPVAMVLREPQEKPLSGKVIGSMVLLGLPSLIYTILRTYVYTAQYEGVTQNFTLIPLLNGTLFPSIIQNIMGLGLALQFLFFVRGPLEVYWLQNITAGVGSLLNSIPALVLAAIGIVGIVAATGWEMTKGKAQVHDEKLPYPSLYSSFWVALGLFALLPNLLKTPGAIGFETLALPFFAMLAALIIFLLKEVRVVGVLLAGLFVVLFTLSSVRVLNLMEFQAIDDERHIIQLVEGVNKEVPGETSVAVELVDVPLSTRTIMNFGEYNRTCSSYDWCILAATNRRTNRIKEAFINTPATTDLSVVRFIYNPDTRDLVSENELMRFMQEATGSAVIEDTSDSPLDGPAQMMEEGADSEGTGSSELEIVDDVLF